MHLLMIVISLAIAWLLRLTRIPTQQTWIGRWHQGLFCFLFPPLLLLTTAISVIFMGFRGEMLGMQASWLSYLVSVTFILIAVFWLLKLAYQGYQSCQKVRTYQRRSILGKIARILETDFPYSAQVGFWQSELVVSQGLLKSLDSEHLNAVLAHEQAHVYYRDTFWFFWLGWLRNLTSWLPNTEALWQELLLLRELRADRKAAEQTDSILLAESLLKVAQNSLQNNSVFCANFSCTVPKNRLEERIDFLLDDTTLISDTSWWNWSWTILLFLPLLTIPFHG
ncbi:MAG: M56 family metallopeptidase [Xenococcaceae cyanobacterium MO_188.B32]|nr:M56 family metallopeptidase [Xenococcaceae cyanobacterium MO_188.B32]